MQAKPSPLGRVPPKGAGEVRYNCLSFRYFSANSYCGTTSSVFFIALGGDEKSTFPKGEGFLIPHILDTHPPDWYNIPTVSGS